MSKPTDKQLKMLKKYLPEIASTSVTSCMFDGKDDDLGKQLLREADELSDDDFDEDALKKSVRRKNKNFKILKKNFAKAIVSAAAKLTKTTKRRNIDIDDDFYAPCDASNKCNVCGQDNNTKQASIIHKERVHPTYTLFCQFGDCGCIYENENEERIHLQRHDD